MVKKATLKEVAQAAGVSTQTVSRVVNQRPDVAEDTRAHIQELILKLGYQPNTIARSLITRRTHTLGVVATGLEYYGPSTILVGIQQEAEALGFSLTLLLTHEPEKEDFSSTLFDLAGRQVDGILWAVPPVGQNRTKTVAPILHQLPPILFLNQPDPAFSVAAIDNRLGAVLAVDHLLHQGYQHIGMITGPETWWEAAERRAGWAAALTAAGQHPDSRLVSAGDWTAAGGERAFLELIQHFPELNSVFVSNDQMALGVYKAARDLGKNIPDQLGIVGFDDYPEAAFFLPSLTTIRQPLRELGAVAVREIVKLIQCPKDLHLNQLPTSVLLKPQLILRESTRIK